MAQTILSQSILNEAHQMALTGHLWHKGRSKVNGRPFYVIPSRTEPDVAHYSTRYGCTCKGFRRRGDCAHSEAVRMFEAREAAGRKLSLDDLMETHRREERRELVDAF